MSSASALPTFFVDLGSPYAYLAAERIDAVVGEARWQVVLLGGIFRALGRSSWAESSRREAGRGEIEARAAERGLPPICWPEPWPSDGLLAARTATWADREGAGRPFIEHALRLHFAEGGTLSDPANVDEVAARCGLDPAAARAGAADPQIKALLRDRTDAALAAGVYGVPSIQVGPFVLWGDDQLEIAATIARALR